MEKNIKNIHNVYMHKQITLLCSRNQHNIVNQLYFKKNKFKNKHRKISPTK